MAISDEESTPLAGRRVVPMTKAGSQARISLRGTALVFFAALGVFSVASVCARSIFPRGVKGRASAPDQQQQQQQQKLEELASSSAVELKKYEDGHEILSSPQQKLASLPELQQEQDDDDDDVLHSLSPGMMCCSREATDKPVADHWIGRFPSLSCS